MAAARTIDEVARLRHIVETQRLVDAADLSLDEVMQMVAERAQAVTGADGAAVELIEGDEMIYRAVCGLVSGALGLRMRVTSSLSGRCARLGVPMRCVDTDYDARVDRDVCRELGIRSMVVVPVLNGDQAVAAVKALSAEPDRFTESDVEVLQELGRLVGKQLATPRHVD